MQQLGNAIATVVAGGLLVLCLAVFLWQLIKGVGYSARTGRFTRDEDPFSFWLSMLVAGPIVVLVPTMGVIALLGAL